MNDSSQLPPPDFTAPSEQDHGELTAEASSSSNILKVIFPILALAIGLITAWALFSLRPTVPEQTAAAESPEVQVISVQPETIKLSVVSHGVVAPRTETQLAAQVAGQVKQISPALTAGGFFQNNELLLVIDPADYDHAIQQSQAAIAEARLRLKKELAEAEQARVEWRALGQGKPSDYTLHKPQVAAARENLKSAEAELEHARVNRQRTEIRAPYAGRVREKSVDKGQFVAVGDKLARIYATDWAEIPLPITAEQLEYLDLPLGDPAKASQATGIDVEISARLAGQTQRWRGQIMRTKGVWDDKTTTLHAIAAVASPYATHTPLAVGLFVEARIAGRERKDVYRIPIGALHAGHQVWIADSDSRLRLREITVLKTELDHVLLSAGLKPGERVVLTSLDLPVEGMHLQVTSASP
jgi:RND family efflux transporter MFP subunit